MSDNLFLVNAPAGSGKTTYIKKSVIEHSSSFPNDNILCITFTNRAADELSSGIKSDNIFISTIHTFIHETVKPFFKHPSFIDLYFEVYTEEIIARIDNVAEKAHIAESNQKYIEENGTLDIETIKNNVSELFYNELQYNSLYKGGLSHDDLLSFTKLAFDRFPILGIRLSSKFQLVFVDEYQDTSQYALKIIYNTFKNTTTQVYFFGDKMQRIYNNYDNSFESDFELMNKSISLETNYRSSPQIVSILNKLYNDERNLQTSSSTHNNSSSHPPRVFLTSAINDKVSIELSNEPNALQLYLPNQKKFETIGAGELYREINKLDAYKFGAKVRASEILITNAEDNRDPLLKILYLLLEINDLYLVNNLGGVLQIIRNNQDVFIDANVLFSGHRSKYALAVIFDEINNILSNPNKLIKDLLDYVRNSSVMSEDYAEKCFEDDLYSDVLNLNITELVAIRDLKTLSNVSTQHGVKGESHDSVFFIAEDSSALSVQMYAFFELLCKTEVSLSIMEDFHFKYNEMIEKFENDHIKINELNRNNYQEYCSALSVLSAEIGHAFSDNEIFINLYKVDYTQYNLEPKVTKAKKCFKSSKSLSCLNAYKLFYVGCSRARRNLSVFMDYSKVTEYVGLLIPKLQELGFEVLQD